MRWIKDHAQIVVFVLIFTLILTTMGISAAGNGRWSAVKSAVNSGISDVFTPLSDAGSGISSFFSGLKNIRKQQTENQKLRQKIAELEEELARERMTELEYRDMKALEKSLEYAGYDKEYRRVTAKVTAAGSADIFDTFMINAGTDDGVRIDDIVVCSEGLAGRISDAGRDWAKVTGIVDPSVSVSFCVLRDPSVIGVAKGDGAGGITGYLFDDSDFILESDVLVTSGLGFYPQGIRIAQVDTVHISENTKKKEITAFTEVDFRSVRMVTVLTKDLQR